MKKELCIILPYIELPNYVLLAVDSIITKYNYHLFLIDNNSSEKTKIELEHLENSKNVTIVHNPANYGCAGSWNQGINLALSKYNPKYITILNNDIVLHPDCIDNMIQVIESENYALVSAYDSCQECSFPSDIKKLSIPDHQFVVDAPDFSCFTLNIRALDILRVREKGIEEFPGLFDQKFYPAYFEDNDFHYRLKLNNMRGVKTNSALFYHFGSRTIKENNEVGLISNTYYLSNRQRYMAKWGGKQGQEKNKKPFNQ